VIFTETELPGAFVIDIERRADDRGFFARTFCQHEFAAHGLDPVVAQCSIASNLRAGTMRGMHHQVAPAAEAKLVRCTRGTIWDVIVDLRADSPTYLRHVAVELSGDNRRALYVPASFAHGYVTLTDDTEITYQMSEFYSPEHERGAHYLSSAFAISWPVPVTIISAKDAAAPPYTPA
jgi:dTDP-4-dehydrorhamnose 3,5-epimerase